MNLIPLPYRILAAAAIWLASLLAVGIWQRHDVAAAINGKWAKHERAQQVQAARQIKTLEERARASEQKHAADLAQVAADYERKIQDANKQRAVDLAAVRAGTLRLRDPNASAMRTCPGASTKTAAAPSLSDGSKASQLQATDAGLLSSQTSSFLIDFAADADQVAEQLSACQQVILEDRKGQD